MNCELSHVPSRPDKQRETGLTMVMDKGMSLQQSEAFIESCGDYVDLVKFGFGTGLITNHLKEKIRLFKQANIQPYFGGTLFEIFLVRDQFDDYRKFLETYEMEYTEISDGSLEISHEDKLQYIRELSKDMTILSEVGSKKAGVDIPHHEWVEMLKKELEAGSWKVITEARESGTIGIYNKDGSANQELIQNIIDEVSADHILWEAPNKKQQVWFIKLLGSNVNLGNIATDNVIPLETLRLGLRGDTFFDFLPDNLK